MATTPKIIDLDAEFDFPEQPLHIKTVRLLGMDLRVVCDLNSFGLTNAMSDPDPKDIMRFLESMIHPEDFAEFEKTAVNYAPFRGDDGEENMMKMIRRLMEVAAERPTTRPSALPRGASTRSTKPKSAAADSSVRAKASKISR